MAQLLTLGLPLLVGSFLLVALVVRNLSTRQLERQVGILRDQVVTWQCMHDHHVASMDRRLLDLEACAARAEDEARMVSLQVQRLRRSVERRADRPGDREAVLTAGGSW